MVQIISGRYSGIIYHNAGEQKSVVLYKGNLKWNKTSTPVVVARKTLI